VLARAADIARRAIGIRPIGIAIKKPSVRCRKEPPNQLRNIDAAKALRVI
jgi:hypothetical protein